MTHDRVSGTDAFGTRCAGEVIWETANNLATSISSAVEQLLSLVNESLAGESPARSVMAVICEQLANADCHQNQLIAALLEQTRRFQLVLENMSQGVCLFDANKRLVLSNHRYAEIYGLSARQIQPGMTLREIVGLRAKTGNIPKMGYENYIAWVPARDSMNAPTGVIIELENGRSVAIRHKPLEDGGYVATHSDVTDRLKAEAEVSRLALHDCLTGLPNRALFKDRLQQALTTIKSDQICTVLYLDLDRFKMINDTLGHSFGDLLLAAVTERLLRFARPTDTVARLGGDEFAIVQWDISNSQSAVHFAARLVTEIEAPFNIHGHRVMISTSIGIAQAPKDGVSPDELMRNADLALHSAKCKGRGAYCLFEPKLAEAMEQRRAIEFELRSALEANQFELFYQPLVDLRTGRTRALEALLRWNKPEQGVVCASEFVALIEELGLAVELGERVMNEACIQAATWPDDVGVSINISAEQLKSGTLAPTLAVALSRSQLAPSRVELEITETAVIQDPHAARSVLRRLKKLGVGIVLDDFGAGYSSLSYVREFPFDRIKIDRSFISHLSESTTSLAIVRSVIGLCENLGIATTGEGIENRDQLAVLQSERCNEGQGFLFGFPLPARQVLDALGSASLLFTDNPL